MTSLLEGLTILLVYSGLLVGCTLVDPSEWKVPVLVTNVSQYTLKVEPFGDIGLITPVFANENVTLAGDIIKYSRSADLPIYFQLLVDDTASAGDLDDLQRSEMVTLH